MEVHHHSHAHADYESAPGQRPHRKKWTHYVWEFLMLFLAVFCGFLAENEREHFIEHQREKKYAKQLLKDLRNDSAYFASKTRRIKRVFSGQEEFKRKIVNDEATDMDVLTGFMEVYTLLDAKVTSTTFSQMKSSGSLRYIRNDELTSALTEYYDNMVPELISMATVSKDFLQQQLAPWYLKHIRVQDMDNLEDSSYASKVLIIDRSKKTDQEVLNITETYRQVNEGPNQHVDPVAADQVNKLIELLKKEYHLK